MPASCPRLDGSLILFPSKLKCQLSGRCVQSRSACLFIILPVSKPTRLPRQQGWPCTSCSLIQETRICSLEASLQMFQISSLNEDLLSNQPANDQRAGFFSKNELYVQQLTEESPVRILTFGGLPASLEDGHAFQNRAKDRKDSRVTTRQVLAQCQHSHAHAHTQSFHAGSSVLLSKPFPMFAFLPGEVVAHCFSLRSISIDSASGSK